MCFTWYTVTMLSPPVGLLIMIWRFYMTVQQLLCLNVLRGHLMFAGFRTRQPVTCGKPHLSESWRRTRAAASAWHCRWVATHRPSKRQSTVCFNHTQTGFRTTPERYSLTSRRTMQTWICSALSGIWQQIHFSVTVASNWTAILSRYQIKSCELYVPTLLACVVQWCMGIYSTTFAYKTI